MERRTQHWEPRGKKSSGRGKCKSLRVGQTWHVLSHGESQCDWNMSRWGEPRMRSELKAGAGNQMSFAAVTSNVVLSLP